jgi:hypothetical protein
VHAHAVTVRITISKAGKAVLIERLLRASPGDISRTIGSMFDRLKAAGKLTDLGEYDVSVHRRDEPVVPVARAPTPALLPGPPDPDIIARRHVRPVSKRAAAPPRPPLPAAELVCRRLCKMLAGGPSEREQLRKECRRSRDYSEAAFDQAVVLLTTRGWAAEEGTLLTLTAEGQAIARRSRAARHRGRQFQGPR